MTFFAEAADLGKEAQISLANHLAPSARSNPTAFQAVSFERLDPYENREDDGIPAKRARGLRPEVSLSLVYKVPLQDTAWEGSRACSRSDQTDLPSTGGCNRAWSGITRPRPSVAGGTADPGSGEVGTVHKGKIFAASAGGVSGTAKTILGTTHVARGYFCATVGAVDEATIKAYIESQKWDEDDQGFKITAPTEP